jgi:hypothetical protein
MVQPHNGGLFRAYNGIQLFNILIEYRRSFFAGQFQQLGIRFFYFRQNAD